MRKPHLRASTPARGFLWYLIIVIMWFTVVYGFSNQISSLNFVQKFYANSIWTYWDVAEVGTLLVLIGGLMVVPIHSKKKSRFR